MQRKEAALVQKGSESGAKQVKSHIAVRNTRVGVDGNGMAVCDLVFRHSGNDEKQRAAGNRKAFWGSNGLGQLSGPDHNVRDSSGFVRKELGERQLAPDNQSENRAIAW